MVVVSAIARDSNLILCWFYFLQAHPKYSYSYYAWDLLYYTLVNSGGGSGDGADVLCGGSSLLDVDGDKVVAVTKGSSRSCSPEVDIVVSLWFFSATFVLALISTEIEFAPVDALGSPPEVLSISRPPSTLSSAFDVISSYIGADSTVSLVSFSNDRDLTSHHGVGVGVDADELLCVSS